MTGVFFFYELAAEFLLKMGFGLLVCPHDGVGTATLFLFPSALNNQRPEAEQRRRPQRLRLLRCACGLLAT